jgi:hypothetical protein
MVTTISAMPFVRRKLKTVFLRTTSHPKGSSPSRPGLDLLPTFMFSKINLRGTALPSALGRNNGCQLTGSGARSVCAYWTSRGLNSLLFFDEVPCMGQAGEHGGSKVRRMNRACT